MHTAEQFYAEFDRAGLLVSAVWTPSSGCAAQTARVRRAAPGQDLFGGAAQSTAYAITYPATQLVGLDNGETIAVDGVAYTVREVTQLGDGSVMRATLARP